MTGSLRAVVSDPALCLDARISFDSDYSFTSALPVQPDFIPPWQIDPSAARTGNNIPIIRAMTIDGSGHNVTLTGSNGVLYLWGSNPDVPLVLKNVSVEDATRPVYVIGNVTIENVSFSGNTCGLGGAISNRGALSVTNSSFTGNSATAQHIKEGDGGGGAIYNYENAYLTVSGSTFANNTAYLGPGGAINNRSVHGTYITNSTFYGNSSYMAGGAIASEQPVSALFLTNNTIVGNEVTSSEGSTYVHGAGIYLGGWGSEIRNSIVAGNTGGNGNCDFLAPITGSNNLSDDDSCGTAGFTQHRALQINLGALGNYGGPTQTIPLYFGSAAIDAGDDSYSPTTDQRGVTRPFNGNGDGSAITDIGAFESQIFSISGTVFNDANGNGTWDDGKTGLDGAYIEVDWGCNDQSVWPVPVNPDGTYSIYNLPSNFCFDLSAGHLSFFYTVGWKETTPPVMFDSLSADQTGVNIGLQEYSLAVSPDTLPDGQVDQAYSQALTISGGVTPYSYNMGSEANLTGLDVSMDANTSVITISGTPTEAGQYFLDLYIEDSKGVEREVQALFFIKTDPALSLTSSLNPSLKGQEVTFSFSATITSSPIPPWGQVTFYADGAVIAGCDGLWLRYDPILEQPAPNPVTCTTSALAAGSHAITATLTIFYGPYNDSTATLPGGQTVNADVPQYQSTGFGAPLDLGGVLNTAKAGQMIPLKWRLLDASGNPVLNLDPASVTMTVSPYACPSGVTTDAIETYATGTSSLQNLGDGYYQLNWKTDKAYINSCRKLTLKIGDWSGDGFIALFQFKK